MSGRPVPVSALTLATDGNLYGTTAGGGAANQGTVFKITPGGTLTTMYSFCAEAGCTDGASPAAALIQSTKGELYGTTVNGGVNDNDACTVVSAPGCGTVFKITPGGKLTTLYSFCSLAGCVDGYHPAAGLVEASNGEFYGTTEFGGANTYYGTVFKMTPSGTLTTLYSFCSQSGCADGQDPLGALVQATNGDLYGTTYYGNATVFRITPGGKLATLDTFGGEPYAGLVQGTDGNFYGTAAKNGIYHWGMIYKITPGGTMTTVYSFCLQLSQGNCLDGATPTTDLVQDTNGDFFGTTSEGGAKTTCLPCGAGTVFRLSMGLGPFVETLPAAGEVGAAVKILGTN